MSTTLIIWVHLDMTTLLIDAPPLRAIVLYDVASPSRGRWILVGGYCDPRVSIGVLGLSLVLYYGSLVHMY